MQVTLEKFSYEATFWELTAASPPLETNIIKEKYLKQAIPT